MRHIILHHGIDEGYGQYIKEANENLDKEKVRKKEIEEQIKKLQTEIKDQEGHKREVENELQEIEESLKMVGVEKESAELKLQDLLQEQQSLETKLLELRELISKEGAKVVQESQVAKTVSEAEDIKLAEAALRQAMELIKEQGATEENIKDLSLKIEKYLNESDHNLWDIELLTETQKLTESFDLQNSVFAPTESKQNQDLHSKNDHYVYVIGMN